MTIRPIIIINISYGTQLHLSSNKIVWCEILIVSLDINVLNKKFFQQAANLLQESAMLINLSQIKINK